MDKGLLIECISEIIENADEALRDYPNGDYKDGAMLAYSSALSSLKYKLKHVALEDLAEYGLDFDVDERYLFDKPE